MTSPSSPFVEILVYKKIPVDKTLFFKCPHYRYHIKQSLSFLLPKTERNSYAFDLVAEESVIRYDGQEYRIKKMRKFSRGRTPFKDIQQAHHVFFDIIDDYQYETISGTLNIVQALTHVFSVTEWTWVTQGAFNTVEFENFGDGTALELFQTILDRYGAEFEISGERQITIKNEIGIPRDSQFRFGHNTKTIYQDIDSSNVSTYIRGYGDNVTAEYTSPNYITYGIRHAPPVRDDRFKSYTSLLNHIKNLITDTPNIVVEVEVVELINQGIPIHEYHLGDTIYLIHEDIGIDATVRVLEKTDYPESKKSPSVVLSNFKNTITKIMSSFSQTSKTLKQLTDGDGNLSLQLKRLYRNTNHYSDHTGDWYISPDDPNAYVHIGAGGLDVHRGLIRVERADGYAILISGEAQFDMTVQSGSPTYIDDTRNGDGTYAVTVEGPYAKTNSTAYMRFDYLSFKHTARYLNITLYGRGGGAGAYVYAQVRDENGNTLATNLTNSTADTNIGITIDLGVPTGSYRVFYIYFRTTSGSYPASLRMATKYMNG